MLTMIQPQLASAEQNEKKTLWELPPEYEIYSFRQVRQQLQETLDQFVTRLRFIMWILVCW